MVNINYCSLTVWKSELKNWEPRQIHVLQHSNFLELCSGIYVDIHIVVHCLLVLSLFPKYFSHFVLHCYHYQSTLEIHSMTLFQNFFIPQVHDIQWLIFTPPLPHSEFVYLVFLCTFRYTVTVLMFWVYSLVLTRHLNVN